MTNLINDILNADGDHEEPPFHLITTDHPYMATLGLSAFTTGTLYRWWNQKDGKGEYENHKYFKWAVGTELLTVPDLLLLGKGKDENDDLFTFTDKESEIGKNQFAFQAWRNEPEDDEGRKSGKYETKYIDGEWDFFEERFNEAGNLRNYEYANLSLGEYDNLFLEEDMTKGYSFKIPTGQGGGPVPVRFIGVSPITNVIVLNDYVRDLELRLPLRAGNVDDNDNWKTSDFARHEFILDIQASKEGYVEWSGLVPFNLKLAGNSIDCVKTEWVKYRLHLHPNSAPKSTRRGIAMATPTFVGPPVDSLGRRYQKKEDGRFSAFPEGSDSAKIVAELDMNYNEYTGKWEAGSKQMIGIVTQRIPRARLLTVKQLRELRPEEMLASPDNPQSHIIWGSGAVMPLSQQNANPMQWTPNYEEPAEINEEGKFEAICPAIANEEEEKKKVELKVFNASAKALDTDQMVLLNQIDGQWFAIDFPSGVEDLKDEITLGVEGRWEFSYCATNVVHHFRDADFVEIDSDDIVQGFHNKYYKNDPLNEGTYHNSRDIDNRINGGYHQFTSFDMMDKWIAGTRERGNAYATTNSIIAPDGTSIEKDRDGFHTGAFFGCIFPDGYNSRQIAEYMDERNFSVQPTIAISGFSLSVDQIARNVEGTWKHKEKQAEAFQYFHDYGIAHSVFPFKRELEGGDDRNDCGGQHIRHEGEEGNLGDYMTMFDDPKDIALTNLPADIATNAAPSGKHGQPIPNLHMIEEMYRKPHADEAARSEGVIDFFKSGKNWLRREWDDHDEEAVAETPHYEDGSIKKVHMESSAFDFQPKKPNHIIFRPLKAEVYAQFSQGNIKYLGPGAGQDTLDRHDFGGEVCTQMKSGFRPSSQIAYLREFNWDKGDDEGFSTPGLTGNIYPIYNDYWGLQFNIDIPVYADSIEFKLSGHAVLPRYMRFREDAWGGEQNGWCHGGGVEIDGLNPRWRGPTDEAPAGAVGIIGAVSTCAAKTTINFVTTNRLGVWSWGYIRNSVFYHKAAWGKDNSYRDFQTTGLHVRIYHAWPREDTIYDPRYFAVHHFNAGTLGFDERFTRPFMNTTRAEITQKNEDEATASAGILFNHYDYEIDEPMYNVDYRVPSAKAAKPLIGRINEVLQLEVEDVIWKNSAQRLIVDGEEGFSEHVESLPQKQWKIDTSRRGKLLPYKFKKKTISMLGEPGAGANIDVNLYYDGFARFVGVPTRYETGGYVVTHNPDDGWVTKPFKNFYEYPQPPGAPDNPGVEGEIDNQAKKNNISFVVRDPGKGYKVGDMFTMPTTVAEGVKVRVTEVDNGAELGSTGHVTGLEVINTGSNFEYSAFVAFDRPITKDSSGGAYFVNATSENGGTDNGIGFKAFLVSGRVIEVEVEDKKPKIATSNESHLLSSRSDSNADNTEGVFGLIDGKTEPSQEIIIKEHNEIDGRYDLFFRFHNDISHTFLSDDHKGDTSRWCNDEQYVDLTITTS